MASNSESKGTAVLATSIVFLVLAALSVACRLIARVGYVKNPGKDDVVIVIALLACIALIVATGFQVQYGLGKHVSETTPEGVSKMLKCVPINAFWLGGGKCIPNEFLWFFNAACNILTDLVIIILPMPVLSSLKLPLKQKIGLMFVFALGGFVCLVSVLRLHSLYIVSNSKDLTWDNADTAIWSNIEVMTGIICACMPATKPLISRFFPHLLSTNHSRQATAPSQGRSHCLRSGLGNSTPVRLTDVDGEHKTVTRVEVGEGVYREQRDVERASIVDDSGSGGSGHGRDIFVTTSMTQDVERKSETGSEKDLIIQHN